MTDKELITYHLDELNRIISEDHEERAILVLVAIDKEARSLVIGHQVKIAAMLLGEMKKEDSPLLDLIIESTLGYVVLNQKEDEVLDKFKDLFNETSSWRSTSGSRGSPDRHGARADPEQLARPRAGRLGEQPQVENAPLAGGRRHFDHDLRAGDAASLDLDAGLGRREGAERGQCQDGGPRDEGAQRETFPFHSGTARLSRSDRGVRQAVTPARAARCAACCAGRTVCQKTPRHARPGARAGPFGPARE